MIALNSVRPRRKTKPAALAALVLTLCALPASAGIQILAITSSTDFQPALIAAGSLETVWCTGLTGIQGIVSAEGPVLPTQLAGVSVYAGGSVGAPILAIADLGGYQQINIQVPWDAYGSNTMVVKQGQQSASSDIVGYPQWPVFFVNSAGYLVAQHAAGYQLVTPENPAKPGEWIVGYASNLGPVANTPPTGVVTSLAPLSPLAPVPAATGGSAPVYAVVISEPNQQVDYHTEPVESNYMGLAPLTVGVYQINFRIPDAPPTGNATVYMRKNVDCYQFNPQCGQGLTFTLSTAAKLPISP